MQKQSHCLTTKANKGLKAEWEAQETTSHQDHVIAHVVGAKVLAYFIHDDSIHILLDMEFLWTIYVDGQMSLLTYPITVAELELEDEAKGEIKLEIQKILRGDSGQHRFLTIPEVQGLIDEVLIYSKENQRRFVINLGNSSLVVESDIESGEFMVTTAT